MEKNYLEITVSGEVQGVGFRMFAKNQADKLHLQGYAENRADGSVLVVSAGEKEVQEMFLRKLKKGPFFSSVEKIETKEIEAFEADSFEIR